ncbi:Stk1 family PASTA domain-containing Ser/Thr kinase [Haloimpatiens sp. FM7315]|uniref:Stk1 family PASTA domain-containing Ser/Thr kinase n=1 Tax=Haloimpatiens sp. FM7315 TaxID=3298609 RepID=UPI0035A3D50D
MVGAMLGNRYELIEKIGEGGMAEVYKAKCHILNRFVAIKILKKEFINSKDFVSKFQAEAKAAGSLSDNHIVNIYDVGSEENVNYIVMEYIAGKTLKEVIKEYGTLEFSTAIEIGIQIAKALECAHKNNIIHRDIKPHNIMITEQGNVKVTDFGIARMSNFSTITNTSKVVGSAHYFSPEQAKGSIVDCRSDLYSLGIILYEMVTGKVPYDADTPVSIALKHIQEDVVPPINLNKNVPENLNNLILKCIEKEPVRRYQNAATLIKDLKAIKYNKDADINFNNYSNEYTRVMDPVDVKTIQDSLLHNKDLYGNKDGLDEDDEDHEEEEEVKKPKKKNKIIKNKKIPIIILSVVVFVALIGIVANMYLKGGFSNKSVVIPNIIGMDKDEAKKSLESKGLEFKIKSQERSDKPKGEVLESFPMEGVKVKKGSEVKVVISAGNDSEIVPNVVGLDLEEAKELITKNNLNVGEIVFKDNSDYEKNEVTKQSPKADEEVKAGEKVDLVVNGSSEKEVLVPDLTNKTLEEAKAVLESFKLRIGKTAEINTNDKEKDGKIYNQSISPNSKVPKETEINISYFKYKENVLP